MVVNSGQSAARCRVKGCESLAAMGRAYCLRCEEEIDALRGWGERQDELREKVEAERRSARLARRLRIALDIVNAVVVVAGVVYVGTAVAVWLLQWLGWF